MWKPELECLISTKKKEQYANRMEDYYDEMLEKKKKDAQKMIEEFKKKVKAPSKEESKASSKEESKGEVEESEIKEELKAATTNASKRASLVQRMAPAIREIIINVKFGKKQLKSQASLKRVVAHEKTREYGYCAPFIHKNYTLVFGNQPKQGILADSEMIDMIVHAFNNKFNTDDLTLSLPRVFKDIETADDSE